MADADDHKLCPRCHCCDWVWEECYACGGDGVSGHDCGEDCCCCLYPEDNVRCDICDGAGGWYQCLGHCDEHGKHGPEPEYARQYIDDYSDADGGPDGYRPNEANSEEKEARR